jgi:hypothetical protein
LAQDICPISIASGKPTGCHLGCKLLDPETKKCLLLTLMEKKIKGDDKKE